MQINGLGIGISILLRMKPSISERLSDLPKGIHFFFLFACFDTGFHDTAQAAFEQLTM
jgi:hypothetical protein